ncbi:MAG TPA: sugar phosphate isomerase/epimerase family protein [Bacteroidota bacterium]|nr:sugar phosphate isomerase/epimerase family protein [Bacteroidota bacterium]
MTTSSRRTFLKMAGIAAAAGALPLSQPLAQEKKERKAFPFGLGVASYTFRAFNLEQTIALTKRLGVERLGLKDVHLPLTSSGEEIASVRAKVKDAGLTLTTCGVVYMTSENEVERAFSYAKALGVKFLVGAPDESLLASAERAVKATDIALAIHNHGPTDNRYPSPESAYRLIEKMDRRMGLCIDCGHTQRLGLDPAAEAERFFDRLIDLHVKDVSAPVAAGTTVEIGRGVMDIPKLLTTLNRLKYAGTLHLEYEKDEKDPLPGAAESTGYLRGVLSTM